MRRLFISLFVTSAVLGLSTALLSPAAMAASDKDKVTIAVGGKNLFYYLPLTIAERKGFFKEEGVNVEIIDFAGGSKALQAVVGGSADVVSGAYEHTISLQGKKQFFTAFCAAGPGATDCVGCLDQDHAQLHVNCRLKG